MIKKWQMAIKFMITIEEGTGVIQKLLVTGFEAKNRDLTSPWVQRPIQMLADS
jgi:hypothetical protein